MVLQLNPNSSARNLSVPGAFMSISLLRKKVVYKAGQLCYNHNNDFKLYHFKEAKYYGTHR